MSEDCFQEAGRVRGAWSAASMFHPRTALLINTGALARWKDALCLGELFQQFGARPEKPLKRLTCRRTALHRAKAPVLMRGQGNSPGISGEEPGAWSRRPQAVEIVGSSRAYDLHQKKGAYRRNGVREYLAWITGEERLLWWELREEEYQELAAGADGLLQSRSFPGLWLDTRSLLRGDMKAVLAALRRGLDSPEHRAFVAK